MAGGSWRIEAIAKPNGEWEYSALRFARQNEAFIFGHAMQVLGAVREIRLVKSDDAPNYRLTDDGMLEAAKAICEKS